MIASRAIHFVSVETAIANVFADMATHCNDGYEREQNYEKACQNYRTALDFLQKPGLAPDQRNELNLRLDDVRTKLVQLANNIEGRKQVQPLNASSETLVLTTAGPKG